MTVISAPGKAFLFGEYAVLEGAPAVVAAVDVRAFAWDVIEADDAGTAAEDPRQGWPACEPTPEVVAAIEVTNGWLETQGLTAVGGRPALDSRRFAPGLRKLGFGSSAAAAVAAPSGSFPLAHLSTPPMAMRSVQQCGLKHKNRKVK